MRRTLAQIAGIAPSHRYRDGGHVRGPGTGTSDSIPARLSDGEFVMPADTVRKVGVRRLQDLVDMTHAPTGKTSQATHFADGGPASYDDFEQQMAAQRSASKQRAQASFRAMDEEAKTAAADAAGMPSAQSPTTAPATQPVTDRVSQIPTGGLKAPAADGSQDSWANTETGRNLTNIASALPGSLGGAIPAVAKTGGAISGGLDAATRLLNAGAGAAAVSALPGSAAAQTSPTSTVGAGRGVVNPPAVNPTAPPPASPPRTLASIAGLPSTTSDVTRVGNSYSGTNVAGDITINGQAPRNGGAISAQNMAAAENLAASQGNGARERLLAAGGVPSPVGMSVQDAQRQGLAGARLTGQGTQPSEQNMTAADNLAAGQGTRGRLMALAMGPGSGPVSPGSFTGGFTGVVGSTSTQGNMLGRTPEQRLRDAEVSASSITNRPEWGGRSAENSAAMQGYRAALQQDNNIRQNQAGADLEAMRQSGSLQREGMQQTGETQRAGIRAQGVNDANEIGRGRLRLEQIAAGYTNRAADRLDRAQTELENAKTPETQRSARERLMALAGKAPQNEWGLSVTPTTKNADGSTTQGSIYRYNKTTGETARVDAGQQMDITKDPRAVAIRDNAKLSPQQKWAELQRLGYL